MDFIAKFFSYLTRLLYQIWNWIADAIIEAIDAFFIMLGDAFLWLFDEGLGLIVTILEGLELDFSVFDPTTYINGLSSEAVAMMGYLKIPEALGIIVAAILIKITLQLIPFTRLGS